MRLRPIIRAISVVCLTLAAACGGGVLYNNAAPSTSQLLPTLSAGAGCPPAAANDAAVGATCSKLGKQCDNTAAPLCSVDFAAVDAAFCTKLCTQDKDCGAGAGCVGDANSPNVRACVPTACLATVPAAAQDSNTQASNSNIPIAAACAPKKANNAGVGGTCSAGGMQCLGSAAPYCSANYANDSAFCTKLCTSTSQCGQGAVCAGPSDGQGNKACVPQACLDAGANSVVISTVCSTASGNARGVGQACTSATQCDGRPANTCASQVVAHVATSFCTLFCTATTDCGDGAHCALDSKTPPFGMCALNTCQ